MDLIEQVTLRCATCPSRANEHRLQATIEWQEQEITRLKHEIKNMIDETDETIEAQERTITVLELRISELLERVAAEVARARTGFLNTTSG